MKNSYVGFVTVATALLAWSNCVSAWGERGHDLITRVAVQNLRLASDDSAALVTPFVARDHMLGHLSNVPDIVWKASYMPELLRKENSPTHYINLEKVYQGVLRWDDLPRDFAVYSKDALARGYKTEEVGSAPWTALQYYNEMVTALTRVAQAKDKNEFEDKVNEALLLAGLMSHFVGDLSNPLHTTANHDGQLSGQRGIHAYFESDVIALLPFELSSLVERQAKKPWLKGYSKSERKSVLADPQKLIWALLANSHSRLPALLKLDTRVSLLEKSGDSRTWAKRKPVHKVTRHYKKIAVERLGVGAAVLSKLWLLAWQEAGSPDLSKYRSYDYPVKPDFIQPNYFLK